jgi:sec-independent protein translocase protein TatA
MDFLGIGAGELLLIVIIAFIAIGPARIPKAARAIARTVNTLKKASGELTSQVTRELEAQEKALDEARNAVKSALDDTQNASPIIPLRSDLKK